MRSASILSTVNICFHCTVYSRLEMPTAQVRIADLSSVDISWKMLTLARPKTKIEEDIFSKARLKGFKGTVYYIHKHKSFELSDHWPKSRHIEIMRKFEPSHREMFPAWNPSAKKCSAPEI